MCKKITSEHCFDVTSAEKVTIFQWTLKLVRGLELIFLTKIINVWHPMDHTVYLKGDVVNKIMH